MNTVIKVENLSKQYRLGSVGTGSLAHDLNRAWHNVLGKEDPYLKIGEENDRAARAGSEYVWALRDINFEVAHGEVLGVIGRNGAGKSTLLKILSRTTSPTTGSVKIKGRVASLLEVGTGFHPELSGRENIFLNGAILGMTRQEIKSKFDEIVDFAGVERYIDTPVKRYSSGMYVRLAFGVAAHLEPEILIVDEVLAVGDAEFQKKALGKMKQVSNQEGRTVLFVSHNMVAIQNICKKILFLKNGTVKSIGETSGVINDYLGDGKSVTNLISSVTNRKGNGNLLFTDVIINGDQHSRLNVVEAFTNTNIDVYFSLVSDIKIANCRIDIGINNLLGDRVAWLSTDTLGVLPDIENGRIRFTIRHTPFSPGEYNCNFYCELNGEVADWITEVVSFKVAEKDYYGTGRTVIPRQGNILLQYEIETCF